MVTTREKPMTDISIALENGKRQARQIRVLGFQSQMSQKSIALNPFVPNGASGIGRERDNQR